MFRPIEQPGLARTRTSGVNLPNALSIGRIIVAPLIAMLPFAAGWELRLAGFALFIAAAITDYYDGVIARTRNLVTDLGKQLDPLADKLLLVATLVPIFILMRREPLAYPLDFITPLGRLGLPLWALIVVLGRELFMTVFRHIAARRGVVIAAIGPAKVKTVMQNIWVGAAYFWFAAVAAAQRYDWTGTLWLVFANVNGVIGVVAMLASIVLTLYSLALYLSKYAGVMRWTRD
ncbi:MAG: CDP-alcohol phosphatidyltransferase family protein [Gemmatimonadaceae bacterium]